MEIKKGQVWRSLKTEEEIIVKSYNEVSVQFTDNRGALIKDFLIDLFDSFA